MKRAVLLLIALPALCAAIAAASYAVRNRNNGSIVVNGRTREYLLYVPKSYDPAKPTPLVISMHGAGGWPVQQRDLSGWNRVADREGIIVVYPAGFRKVWRPRDEHFIAALIDKLHASYNIDRSRIYANGLSNGGGMSFVLSCKLSDQIAAVGLVSSAQTLPWSFCADEHPVPMIAFHGTADEFTPYEGGDNWIAPRPFPSITKWTANWARRNRCASAFLESAVPPDVTRREYPRCANDAAVVLYTFHGGGHTWPGGQRLPEWFAGTTPDSVDATSEMWAFFRAHPLKR